MNFFNLFNRKKRAKPVAQTQPIQTIVEKPAYDIKRITSPQIIKPNIGRVVMPKDIRNIHDLFDYLIMRSSERSLEDSHDVVNEVASIIEEKMLDLRSLPGFVCTDGVYAIQDGVEEDGPRFIMIRMNDYACFQNKEFVVDHAEEFKKLLDAKAVAYLNGLSDVARIRLLNEHTFTYDFRSVKACFGTAWIDMIQTNEHYTPIDDESYSVRKQFGYSLVDSIFSLLKKEFDECRSMFGNEILVFNVGNKKYWIDEHDAIMGANNVIDEHAKPFYGTFMVYNQMPLARKILDSVPNASELTYLSDTLHTRIYPYYDNESA